MSALPRNRAVATVRPWRSFASLGLSEPAALAADAPPPVSLVRRTRRHPLDPTTEDAPGPGALLPGTVVLTAPEPAVPPTR